MADPTQEGDNSPFSKFISACKSNVGDTCAYIVLAISIFYMFFEPFIGGLIVGYISGLYLSSHILLRGQQFREFLLTEGIFRGFVLIAALVAFLISAPGMVVGLLLGTFSRRLYSSFRKTPSSEE